MEVWKWKLVTSNTQLTNDITFIKTIILDHSTTTNVVIDDSASGAGTEFMTVRNTAEILTVPIILDDPAQLDNGCYVEISAGQVWIQYREG